MQEIKSLLKINIKLSPTEKGTKKIAKKIKTTEESIVAANTECIDLQ